MAAPAIPIRLAFPLGRVLERIRPVVVGKPAARRPVGRGTPEIYFAKTIDNSRLVRATDPRRTRELMQLSAACGMLLLLMMVYAWQHFSAVEYGYRIEAQKSQGEQLMELNRQLRLEEAALRDPERIDLLARHMGLEAPEAGQMLRMDQPAVEPEQPVMARAAAAVLPAR